MIDESVPTEEEVARQAEINERAANGSSEGVHSGTGESREDMLQMRERCLRFAAAAPAAFAAATPEVRACALRIGRNFAASSQPAGTPLRLDPACLLHVSAGSDSHGDTTYEAMSCLFDFLREGARGDAATANAQLRQAGTSQGASSGTPPLSS